MPIDCSYLCACRLIILAPTPLYFPLESDLLPFYTPASLLFIFTPLPLYYSYLRLCLFIIRTYASASLFFVFTPLPFYFSPESYEIFFEMQKN